RRTRGPGRRHALPGRRGPRRPGTGISRGRHRRPWFTSGVGAALNVLQLALRSLLLIRRGRVEPDQRLRLLVGQPQDQVVGGKREPRVGLGQRVILVSGQRRHLGGLGRQFAGLVGLVLPEQDHRPEERRWAGHVPVVL